MQSILAIHPNLVPLPGLAGDPAPAPDGAFLASFAAEGGPFAESRPEAKEGAPAAMAPAMVWVMPMMPEPEAGPPMLAGASAVASTVDGTAPDTLTAGVGGVGRSQRTAAQPDPVDLARMVTGSGGQQPMPVPHGPAGGQGVMVAVASAAFPQSILPGVSDGWRQQGDTDPLPTADTATKAAGGAVPMAMTGMSLANAAVEGGPGEASDALPFAPVSPGRMAPARTGAGELAGSPQEVFPRDPALPGPVNLAGRAGVDGGNTLPFWEVETPPVQPAPAPAPGLSGANSAQDGTAGELPVSRAPEIKAARMSVVDAASAAAIGQAAGGKGPGPESASPSGSPLTEGEPLRLDKPETLPPPPSPEPSDQALTGGSRAWGSDNLRRSTAETGAGFWERLITGLSSPGATGPDPAKGGSMPQSGMAGDLPPYRLAGAASGPAGADQGGTKTAGPPTLAKGPAGTAMTSLRPALEDAMVDAAALTMGMAPGAASPGVPLPGALPVGAAPLPAVPQMASQITAALAQGADGATEFTLSPEELGHVRLRLERDARQPDRMMAMITLERPETLDLFRRHAGELADALRSAGYSGADIHFGQGGADSSGSAPREEPASPGARAAAPAEAIDPPPPMQPPGSKAFLDLRL